jgi:hypothetical protein
VSTNFDNVAWVIQFLTSLLNNTSYSKPFRLFMQSLQETYRQVVLQAQETTMQVPITDRIEQMLNISDIDVAIAAILDDVNSDEPIPPAPGAPAASAPAPLTTTTPPAAIVDCYICTMPVDSTGLVHDGRHGICTIQCLSIYIQVQHTQRPLVNSSGLMLCPVDGCQAAFRATHFHDLAQTLDRNDFQILLNAYMAACKNPSLEQQTNSWAAEVEAALTPMCPWCKQAYNDFDGCYLLRCGKCAQSFCGLCEGKLPTALSSTEQHDHVLMCFYHPQPGRSIFMDKSVFYKRHSYRAYRRIVKLFESYAKTNLDRARSIYYRVRPLLVDLALEKPKE